MLSHRHRLPAHSFDELAAGHGGAETVRLLMAGQVSMCLLRVRAILDLTAGQCMDTPWRSAFEQGYHLLAAVQARSPDVLARVLGSPEVGAWSTHCVRRLCGSAEDAVPRDVDVAHLGAVAATAGHLAGLDFAVPVPARHGSVALPLLGHAHVGATASPWTAATVRRDATGTWVSTGIGVVRLPADPRRDGPGWTGLRHLVGDSQGRTLDLRFDDLGPFRDAYGQQPSGRVDPGAFADWQHQVQRAWELLVTHHPRYADGLATGLAAIVPLRARGPLDAVSASIRGSFGAVATTPPRDGVDLAVTLVHEFQHSTLGALLDMVPLYTRDGDARYYAPWRDDPRPIGGLFQGAYAFLGITEFWRMLCTVPGPGQELARVEFARWREGIWGVLRVLRDSGALTEQGRRFVARMRDRVAGWRDDAVPARAGEVAEAMAVDHEVCWRLRNLRADPHLIELLVRAWQHGDPGRVRPAPSTVAGGPAGRGASANTRIDLLRLRTRDPDGFGRLRADPDRLGALVVGATPADLAYADGDFALAVREYRAQIDADPGALHPWAGLVLALHRQSADPGSRILLDAPEVVRAVYARLRQDRTRSVDPTRVARWLSALVPATT